MRDWIHLPNSRNAILWQTFISFLRKIVSDSQNLYKINQYNIKKVNFFIANGRREKKRVFHADKDKQVQTYHLLK